MILTLDPSLNAFGWAIIDEQNHKIINCGCIAYPASKKTKISAMKDKVIGKYDQDTEIVGSIFRKIDDLIKTHKVGAIYTEVPIGSQSSRAAEALSMVKGLVICVANNNRCSLCPISPSKIKQFLSLDKNADKEVIYKIVLEKMPSFALFYPNLMNKTTRHAISDALSVYLSTLKV